MKSIFILLTPLVAVFGAGTIADNHALVDPASIAETCQESRFQRAGDPPLGGSVYYLPPPSMLDSQVDAKSFNNPPGRNIGKNEGRLNGDLRHAAQVGSARESLASAVVQYLKQDDAMGNAFSDLSITGSRAYADFLQTKLTPQTLAAFVRSARASELATLIFPPVLLEPGKIEDASRRALVRANAVASALRQSSTSSQRQSLGWIAVSGEDDMPHRPVNVPSTKYPQYDLTVPVNVRGTNSLLMVHTRYFVAQTRGPRVLRYPLPGQQDVPPLAQDAQIFVYVHGMDSRAEEAEQMADELLKLGRASGINYVLISMDLPGSGYATKIDPFQIAPLADLGHPKGITDFDANGKHNAPQLQFIEDFVVSFVETLDKQVGVKRGLRAIVGGSLGGNMAFRLGRRTDLPWLPAVIAWSPGSIWNSFVDGSDLLKHFVVRKGWENAGGSTENLDEKEGMRADFFKGAFDSSIGPDPPQPQMWYRSDWLCLQNAIAGDRLDRQETYDRKFRLWHWRLGTEQLIYSHQAKDDSTGQVLYLEDRKPMLLGCGVKDDFPFANICGSTQTVAAKMTDTPGKALFLKDTGHSIHNERPAYWASQWNDFLRTLPQDKMKPVPFKVPSGSSTSKKNAQFPTQKR